MLPPSDFTHVEGEREADERPDDHDSAGTEGQSPRSEQRLDVFSAESLHLALDRGLGNCPLRSRSRDHPSSGVRPQRLTRPQVFDAERARCAVPLSHLVYDSHRVLVSPLAHVVLGRLVNVEDEEADDEADERDAPCDDDEVPPAHILASGAGGLGLLAGVATEQGPGDERDD